MQSFKGSEQRLQQRSRFLRLAALGLVTCAPAHVWALGVRIPNQDAEATARGNAFVATADNPSALYYNPAGITQIQGSEAQLGFHVIHVSSHFEGDAGTSSDLKFEVQSVPQFYYVLSPKDR